MILNIGYNKSVFKRDIISIMTFEAVELSEINKSFVSANLVKDKCIDEKEIKSYVFTEENGKTKVYPSYIKSINLLKR